MIGISKQRMVVVLVVAAVAVLLFVSYQRSQMNDLEGLWEAHPEFKRESGAHLVWVYLSKPLFGRGTAWIIIVPEGDGGREKVPSTNVSTEYSISPFVNGQATITFLDVEEGGEWPRQLNLKRDGMRLYLSKEGTVHFVGHKSGPLSESFTLYPDGDESQ